MRCAGVCRSCASSISRAVTSGPTGARLLANLDTTLADTFEDWTAPPPLPEGQLTSLILHNCSLGDSGAQTLFAAKTLSALTSLDISQCRLKDPATLGALRDSAQLTGLRRLSLAGNKEFGGHLAALAGWPVLARLQHLALPQTATAEDFQALFPEPSQVLRSLDLTSAKQLLKTPGVILDAAVSLTALDVGTTGVGNTGLARLLAAPAVHSALELQANRCSLSDAAVGVLTRSGLDRLVTLDLSSNKLTDKGLAQLAEWPGLRNVTHLRLGNNRKVGPPGYRALIGSPHFEPTDLDIGKSSDAAIVEPLRERYGNALRVRTK